MAKLSWNAFVTKHAAKGHLVSTGTQPNLFKKPIGISPNNQKQWPTIPSIIKESIGSRFTGDWAHTTQKVPGWTIKNGKRVKAAAASLYLFAFSDPGDALIAAKFLRAALTTPAPFTRGFASLIKGSEIDTRQYARLVKALGY